MPSAAKPAKSFARPRRRARVDIAPTVARTSAIKASAPAAAQKSTRMRLAAVPKPATAVANVKPPRISALTAAAQLLADRATKERTAGLSAHDLIGRMAKAKLWSSPGGKSPASTLYAAMLREINSRGEESRFARGERGRFTLVDNAKPFRPTKPAKRGARTNDSREGGVTQADAFASTGGNA